LQLPKPALHKTDGGTLQHILGYLLEHQDIVARSPVESKRMNNPQARSDNICNRKTILTRKRGKGQLTQESAALLE
jgi:hypothetical protein